MMKELMMNEEFADVTLVTEDKKQIRANKSVLRTCSPVFEEILKREQNSSPIIYLRGIQYSEMESIIQFIYLGQATLYEERKNDFFAVAKLLEIKDLYNAECETEDEQHDEPSQSDPEMLTEKFKDGTIRFREITKQTLPEEDKCSVTFKSR